MDTANRRLIRPSLNGPKNQNPTKRPPKPKSVPPDQTHAECFYYLKQIQTKTPMVIVLRDGETLQGTIEWYDKSCIKLTRQDAPNVLIYKPSIRYMYKAVS